MWFDSHKIGGILWRIRLVEPAVEAVKYHVLVVVALVSNVTPRIRKGKLGLLVPDAVGGEK